MSSKNPQIYIGGIARKTRESDLEKMFEKYGKIRNFSFKSRYAFIVFIFSINFTLRNMTIIMQLGTL